MTRNQQVVAVVVVSGAALGGFILWQRSKTKAAALRQQLIVAATEESNRLFPQPRELTPAEVAVAVQGGLTEAQAREMALHPQARTGAGHF